MNPDTISKIRPGVYVGSALLALLLFAIALSTIPIRDLMLIRLTQWYAFCAISLLYLTLLASPLYHSFPNFPGREGLGHARKALGLVTFGFGWLHGSLAFFGTLGGFAGLGFLSVKFLLAIIFSSTALLILTLMAIASIPKVSALMGRYWKWLGRLLYLAGALVFTHALIIGTHYINLHNWISILSIALVAFLLLLQARRLDDHLAQKFDPWPNFGVLFVVVVLAIGSVVWWIYAPTASNVSLGIHAQHLAQLQGGNSPSASAPKYSVSIAPLAAQVGQTVNLNFVIYDNTTGNRVTDFSVVHEKLMHTIITDSALTFFNHIHPELKDGIFSIATTFPKADLYRIYLEFSPKGGQDQAVAISLPVGTSSGIAKPQFSPDDNQTKTFASHQVSIKPSAGSSFSIAQMSASKQSIDFHIADQSGAPVTTLEPYLGAFGHLVMIKQDTYQYAHVHPKTIGIGTGGPDVSFQALAFGNFAPLEPGIYRLFGQFQDKGQLFTADFTIELKP